MKLEPFFASARQKIAIFYRVLKKKNNNNQPVFDIGEYKMKEKAEQDSFSKVPENNAFGPLGVFHPEHTQAFFISKNVATFISIKECHNFGISQRMPQISYQSKNVVIFIPIKEGATSYQSKNIPTFISIKECHIFGINQIMRQFS
jgi:hypothetical protein